MQEAPIIEIFSSFQGEGPHAGEKHLFVRFQDCELSCRWCDTPLSFVENKFCRVEHPPFSRKIKHYPNPIPLPMLQEILKDFSEETVAVTGGEPLQKVPFLREWLPTLAGRKVLLETAGVHFRELKEIIDHVSLVSMDLKLPSSTGMRPLWREHEGFLKIARQRETYVKVVVTQDTGDPDILQAVELVASICPTIPFILQPASPGPGGPASPSLGGPASPAPKFRLTPSPDQLARWWEAAKKRLKDVRVLPQIHRQMGVP